MKCEKCERCGSSISAGEERALHGKTLCEDCYMDALSPARACDPWAVHTAKSFSGGESPLNDVQRKILEILKETGGVEPRVLSERLGMSPFDLERELAALRHIERIRGRLEGGRRIVCLW